MGARKAIKAEKIKAEKKQKAIAVLRDCPTSPRKMRLVADIIRGVEINKALGILRFSKKEASIRMEKLLKSAIANWEAKNENERLEDTKLCVKEVFVDGGRMLKRIQAAPQGRAHRGRPKVPAPKRLRFRTGRAGRIRCPGRSTPSRPGYPLS